MKPFNREKFMFLLLAAVMGANATFFAYGLFACSRSAQPHLVCPDLGNRFDNYSEKALAAVLGLIAGAGAFTVTQRRPSSSDDLDEPLASPLPQPPLPPLPKESPAGRQGPARGKG